MEEKKQKSIVTTKPSSRQILSWKKIQNKQKKVNRKQETANRKKGIEEYLNLNFKFHLPRLSSVEAYKLKKYTISCFILITKNFYKLDQKIQTITGNAETKLFTGKLSFLAKEIPASIAIRSIANWQSKLPNFLKQDINLKKLFKKLKSKKVTAKEIIKTQLKTSISEKLKSWRLALPVLASLGIFLLTITFITYKVTQNQAKISPIADVNSYDYHLD